MEIKIISFNIHKGKGWRSKKSTIIEIAQQINILNPDIIFFQEIKGEQFSQFMHEQWTHQTYGKNVISTKGDHGNAILSKFPIIFAKNIDLSSNHIERRGLLHAIVSPSHDKDTMHLLCVHLGLFKKDRTKQVAAIINYIESHIPHRDSLILGGDFNDWTHRETIPLLRELHLQEVFLNLHGEYAKTFPSWAPLLRLDRIYYRNIHAEKAYRIIQTPWKMLSDHIAIYAHLNFSKR